MTEELTMTIKEILDRTGLDISVEQIEAGLDNMVEEIPDEDPWPDEIIRKIKAERKENGQSSEEGLSWKGGGQYLAISGTVDLEYSGRAYKKYQGDAIMLVKPDDSLVVHGMRGVNPVSYIARAEVIRCRDEDRKFTVMAVAGSDRLVVTFHKMYVLENLFEKAQLKNITQPADKPTDEKVILTDEEKALEARLRKLRLDLAHRDGISFLPAVYDNRTMHQLVRQRPKTLEELKQVKGFGAKRIERYAVSVLETINGPLKA